MLTKYCPGRRARLLRDERGITLSELLVTMFIIAVLATIVGVAAATYLPGLQVRWAARELQSSINRAKMLAVTNRQFGCVDTAAGNVGVRFRTGATIVNLCTAGVIWTGPGTDNNGVMAASNQTTVGFVGTRAIFTQFGTASQVGQYTIQRAGSRITTVTVTGAGQVTIP